MGLVKTRMLPVMKKQRREGGADIRKSPITKIIYNEGGYFGSPTAFVIDPYLIVNRP